jgi:hypothetical protein
MISTGIYTNLNYVVSSSSGTFTTASATYTDVTNLTTTITTTGFPVILFLDYDGSTSNAQLSVRGGSSGEAQCFIQLLRATTNIWQFQYQHYVSGSSVSWYAHPCLFHKDDISAGTYTYKVQTHVGGVTNLIGFRGLVLKAYELRGASPL